MTSLTDNRQRHNWYPQPGARVTTNILGIEIVRVWTRSVSEQGEGGVGTFAEERSSLHDDAAAVHVS